MIHIKDWVIDADERCYIVGKLKTRKIKDKDGNEKTESFISNARYYSSLRTAFNGVLESERRNVVQDNELTLAEAVLRMTQMQDEFCALFRSILMEEDTL